MRRHGRALEQIDDLSGLGRTQPLLAAALAIFMFSLAGIPPLAGFFGKLYVFLAAIEADLVPLAVIGVLTSVIGAYYYLRIVKVMYFDEAEDAFDRPIGREFAIIIGGHRDLQRRLLPVSEPASEPGAERGRGAAVVSGDAELPEGFVLCALDSVASTNDEAKRRAEEGAPGGRWSPPRSRSGGRGRYGRSWASPPGNLYASVLLRPDCPMARAAQLSLVAGLALADALEGIGRPGLDVKLKWPNDVLIGGAKVAGLLLEGAARPDGSAAWVIVGSGVNVASCPEGTPYPATCLAGEGFGELAPLAVLRPYLFALADGLRALATLRFRAGAKGLARALHGPWRRDPAAA